MSEKEMAMQPGQSAHDQESAHDQVWGAEAIGEVINRTARQTWYLLEKGHLPAKKAGGVWTASGSELRRCLSGE